MLTFVGVGCGHRTTGYMEMAMAFPSLYKMVAAADPNPARTARIRDFSQNPDFRCFDSDTSLFAAGKLSDIAIIGTQDNYHVAPCIRAMELGYDILLEKPIAQSIEEVIELEKVRKKLGRKVLVCHVLRYSAFYRRLREILDSGELGQVISIEANEGVGRWHQVHSFVRGHWAVTQNCNPMIVAKSCHDCDLLSWFAGSPASKVSSFGSLTHFRRENAPAGAPARCSQGCPHSSTCHYYAQRYAGPERGWLNLIMDGAKDATDAQIAAWLEGTGSKYGRCAWHCDNSAVDHQVVAIEFANAVTATLTMTAFDNGRDLTIVGTRATLQAGDNTRSLCGHDIYIFSEKGEVRYEDIPRDSSGHGGADGGLVADLANQFVRPIEEMLTGLPASVESHRIAFAAETSRLCGQTVSL